MKEKTLYEILEVSENASGEIIEKAYKTLAKKYHPDLQEEANKKQAEAMMKKINEAYEILGNEEKRSRYDAELEEKRNQEELQKQNNQVYNNVQYQNNNATNNNVNYDYEKERLKYERKLQEEEIRQRQKMQDDLNREYNNAYENYLRSLGYKIKHKWTKENTRDLLITIGVIIVVFIILWIIPPTHDWLVSFYENNPIVKTFVDIIIAIVVGIFKGIWEFITGLFN